MRSLTFLAIPMLFLASCAGSPEEGRAAAVLTKAQPLAIEHASALTGSDLSEMRRTGLRLITVIQCQDECE